MIDQVKSSADWSFFHGGTFLMDMGDGETRGAEEVETELRPCRRKWKGKELEESSEVEGQDIEMILH